MVSEVSPIPVLRPKLPALEEIAPYLRQIDERRVYTNYGPLNAAFASGLAQMIALRARAEQVQITLTNNGTSAIEVALRGRVSKRVGLCLMPSYTFIASVHAVVNAGLEPFFLDIDPSQLVLSPRIAREALERLPGPPSAVLVVSAFGAPVDVPAWEGFESETGIPVVFDAAAAVTSLDHVGQQPICVSLHATKVLGIGEGGAVISQDPLLNERMTAMTGFGFSGAERRALMLGGNYRLSEYGAAVGLAALATIDQKVERLKQVTGYYKSRLQGDVAFQKGVGLDWVTMTFNIIPSAARAARIKAALDETGIPWRHWWGTGSHTHPAFATTKRANLMQTNEIAPRVIGLPFFEDISTAQIDRIASALGPALA